MSGTFTIPEIRCNRHFYGATLCAMQAQAPINEGIVAIEPCAECLENAHAALTAENARLREALAECVTDNPGSACYNTGKKTRRLDAINEIVREALAGGEKEESASALACLVKHASSSNGVCPKGPGGKGGRHNMTWRKRKAGTGFYCDYCGEAEVNHGA